MSLGQLRVDGAGSPGAANDEYPTLRPSGRAYLLLVMFVLVNSVHGHGRVDNCGVCALAAVDYYWFSPAEDRLVLGVDVSLGGECLSKIIALNSLDCGSYESDNHTSGTTDSNGGGVSTTGGDTVTGDHGGGVTIDASTHVTAGSTNGQMTSGASTSGVSTSSTGGYDSVTLGKRCLSQFDCGVAESCQSGFCFCVPGADYSIDGSGQLVGCSCSGSLSLPADGNVPWCLGNLECLSDSDCNNAFCYNRFPPFPGMCGRPDGKVYCEKNSNCAGGYWTTCSEEGFCECRSGYSVYSSGGAGSVRCICDQGNEFNNCSLLYQCGPNSCRCTNGLVGSFCDKECLTSEHCDLSQVCISGECRCTNNFVSEFIPDNSLGLCGCRGVISNGTFDYVLGCNGDFNNCPVGNGRKFCLLEDKCLSDADCPNARCVVRVNGGYDPLDPLRDNFCVRADGMPFCRSDSICGFYPNSVCSADNVCVCNGSSVRLGDDPWVFLGCEFQSSSGDTGISLIVDETAEKSRTDDQKQNIIWVLLAVLCFLIVTAVGIMIYVVLGTRRRWQAVAI